MRRIAALTAALAAGLAGMALQAAPAEAASPRNGVCDAGEFCYYFNSNQAGSVSDLGASLDNYGASQPSCYVFKSGGNGQGKCVKNNAASVWNRTDKPVTVYLNSHYSGASQTIPAGARANLSAQLKNNNASHRDGGARTTPPVPSTPPPGRMMMSQGLYLAPGHLSCGYDGYRNTAGKHEGIDFTRSYGAAVHSLTDGVVTAVRGGGGLSTLAIYQASSNKTVVYLHLAPGNLHVGQQIARGQRIGTESNRGTGATHTHVEVRDGRQTYAAKSLNDYRLDNPNPAAYWVSQGYTVG